MIKGMMVDVYRNSYVDTTNGGISRNTDTLLLVGDDVPEIVEYNSTAPAIKIMCRRFGERDYFYAKPVVHEHRHTMFGGNFIYSSDSRFPFDYPIPIHDRVER